MIEEQMIGKGLLRDPIDSRDHIYDVLAAAPIEIDWERGYDIRNELGDDFEYKNQMSSSSCVGQGISQYAWVLNICEMINKYQKDLAALRGERYDEVKNVSAKAIYSQIFLGGGGAYIRDGMLLLCKWGSLLTSEVPDYKKDGTTDEQFMRDQSWKTKELDLLAQVLMGKDARLIQACSNMNLFAQAIIENKGVVGGVAGQNNGTWMTEAPKPPSWIEWQHCLYFCAFGKDSIGRWIGTPNSWGNFLGKKWYKGAPVGYGLQKIYEPYFAESGKFILNPWTYTDLINKNTLMRFYKTKDSNAVYVLGEGDGLYHPIYSGKVALDVFAKDWKSMKIIIVDEIPKEKIGYRIAGLI